jgi:hypothetical protein
MSKAKTEALKGKEGAKKSDNSVPRHGEKEVEKAEKCAICGKGHKTSEHKK